MGTFMVLLSIAVVLVMLYYTPRFGRWLRVKQRDAEIEANMRLGYRDAQAQRRIAEQIIREHNEGRNR